MDVSDQGTLFRRASSIGRVVHALPLDEDLQRRALALQVQRPSLPTLAIAGSTWHDTILALFLEEETALAALAAARVLVHERADDLQAGRVLTLVAGAPGSRSVRGGTGAFALLDPRPLELPPWMSIFAVAVPAPVSEWEKATADEVRSAVPDLVSRFPRPRRATDHQDVRPPSAPRTLVRRR